MDLLDAAYAVVHDHPGGSVALAARMGKRAESLCHELTATGTAKLGLRDAAKLTDMTGDHRILNAWADRLGYELVAIPELEDDTTTGRVLLDLAAVSSHFANLCTEVAKDIADGAISDNELKRIEHTRTLLLRALMRLRQAVEASNASTHRAA